ncbi:GNAT family N-acetyltransferase [Subtercola boreus]|nr:GNAT family N-acetyltransferase [Subtercola boreus]
MLYDSHRGRYHPAPWEIEVQSGLRALRLPVPDTEAVVFSLDAAGEIVSAVHFSFDSEGQQIIILAIATRSEARGLGLGRQTLEAALQIVDRTKVEYGLDFGVWARIRPQNHPSKRLFSAAGFECIEDLNDPETWVLA